MRNDQEHDLGRFIKRPTHPIKARTVHRDSRSSVGGRQPRISDRSPPHHATRGVEER